MIRPAILAAVLAAVSAQASASTQDRMLASTVMVGVEEPATAGPSLYKIAGQRPTWFRRLVHRFAFGADVSGNPFAGTYYEPAAGVVVDSDRVLTAAHVVLNTQAFRDGGAVFVRFRDGRRVPATVEAIAPHFDAAVLRFQAENAPVPLPVAYSAHIEPGTPLLIAGNPDGRAWWLEQGRAVKLGLLRYYDRDNAITLHGRQRYGFAIEGQAVNGSSGGPVVNERGELVAIVSGALDSPARFAAVPADTALGNVRFWQQQDRSRTRLHCLHSPRKSE